MQEKRHIKEIDSTYKGFRYLVLGLEHGHRCGYVRIPKGHKLYEKDYSAETEVKMSDLKDEQIGKRGIIPMMVQAMGKSEKVSIDCLFDVHGGITFASTFPWYRGWWIGFDCAHMGDAKDPSLLSDSYKESFSRYPSIMGMAGDVIRTKEYVEQECKNLIDQIIKYFGKE